VEHNDALLTHFPSQQWYYPGEQIITTQSSFYSTQEWSGHLILFLGQVSTVGHMKKLKAHSPPGHYIYPEGQLPD